MGWFFKHLAAPLIALVLLAGMAGTGTLHLTPVDAGDYHERVRHAVDDVPFIVGDWVGRDVPVPVQATNLLRPNALLSREYVNTRTGQQISVMLVHCFDARDLQGHYPPVCYPGSGWMPVGSDRRDLQTGGQVMPVAHYRFERRVVADAHHLEVFNLMVLPDGGFGTDMRPVDRVAGSHQIRHLGAAQLQMLPDGNMTEAEQAEVWRLFFDVLAPAIETIQGGSTTSPVR